MFSATVLFPDMLCVFRCFRSPFSGSTIYLMSSNVFDVGVEVMSELLHCHAESSIFSVTDISLDKLSVLWKVRGHSKDCLGFLTVVKTSPSQATMLRFHDSPSCPPALRRFVFEPSQSTARRSGVRNCAVDPFQNTLTHIFKVLRCFEYKSEYYEIESLFSNDNKVLLKYHRFVRPDIQFESENQF